MEKKSCLNFDRKIRQIEQCAEVRFGTNGLKLFHPTEPFFSSKLFILIY